MSKRKVLHHSPTHLTHLTHLGHSRVVLPPWIAKAHPLFMHVYHSLHWWEPGMFAVVGIPAAVWVVSYLFVEFDRFDWDYWILFGRQVASVALPVFYAVWFALPYTLAEWGVLAALAIGLLLWLKRMVGKRRARVAKAFAVEAQRRAVERGEKPSIMDVVRGGRPGQHWYQVEIPMAGKIILKVKAESPAEAEERGLAAARKYDRTYATYPDKTVIRSSGHWEFYEHLFEADQYQGGLTDIRTRRVMAEAFEDEE